MNSSITKKLFLAVLVIFISFFKSPAWGMDNAVSSLIKKAKTAKEEYRDFDAISAYHEILKIDSSNFEALWNISYMYLRVAWLASIQSKAEKNHDYLKKSYFYAKKAYAKYPNTAEGNLVLAGATARMAEYASAKERVHTAWDIKEYAYKARELNPGAHEVWYILGWWNFEISKATKLERWLAKLFFGGLPTGTSFQTAIDCMQRALQLNPGYIVYMYDLATFYEKMEEYDKAIALLDKAIALKQKYPEDKLYIKRCIALKERLKVLQEEDSLW